MTQTTHSSFDLAERQQAFVGLLGMPMVTRDLDPALHRLVSRHRRYLERWLGHLGYRLAVVGHTYRVRRCTRPGLAVTVPASDPPDRRVLVLLLVIAAVLEEVRSDSVDIQSISDAVRDTVAVQHLTAYDPARRVDRKLLVAAVRRAEQHGVLRRLTRGELLSTWEEGGEGVGGGYAINRHALFLLVDPIDSATALAQDSRSAEVEPMAGAGGTDDADDADPGQPDPRGQMLLRALVETQGLHLAELTEPQRDYWRRQRSRLIARAVELTGGSVEVTGECATLILPTDHRAARESTETFPSPKAAHWVTLRLLDQAARSGEPRPGGRLFWDGAAVDACCAAISEDLDTRLPADLRGQPEAIRRAAETTLATMGLLRIDETGWWLSPLAARYRSATLSVSLRPSATVEEDE